MKKTLILCFMIASFMAKAQNTMYFMEQLPQGRTYNPAFSPDAEFFLGLPGIGGISANAYNSGFNYNWLDNFLNSVVTTGYDPDEIVRSIGEHNNLFAEAQVNIFSLGLKLKEKEYISFNASFNNSSEMSVATDIVYLLADIDDISTDDFPLVVDGVDILTNNYFSLGFTYSRIINDNLTLGISPHLNLNQMGIQAQNISYIIDIEETQNDYYEHNESFSGDVILGLPVEINPDAVEGNVFDLNKGFLPDNWMETTRFSDFFRNKSLSLDLGGTYNLNKWMFSASILNIGASRWRTNGYILNGNNDQITVKSNETVIIRIPTKIFLGARRQFASNWNYALLFRNDFYDNRSNTSATVSLNGDISEFFSLSTSYTAGYKWNNFGLGIRLRFLPGTDLFFVTDNIIQGMDYKNAYRLTAAFGINIAVGKDQ